MSEETKQGFKGQRLLTAAESMLYMGVRGRNNFRNIVKKYNLINCSPDERARYDIQDLDNVIQLKKEEREKELIEKKTMIKVS